MKMEKINRNISIPLYYQIQEILEEKILSGEWPEGYQLPTEKNLSEFFDVSTITVKRAIHELVNKGLLYRVRAKGTFVSKELKEENIFNLVTFGYEQEEMSDHKILNSAIETAERNVVRKLLLKKGDQVIRLDRLKLEGTEAIAIERTYIVHYIMPDFPLKRSETDTIYNIIRDEPAIKLGKAKVYFSTTTATDEEADLLEIDKGTPLIIMERISYLSTMHPIEYSKFIMRQDKAKYFFEVDLQ